jgi:hypothetical protein
LATVIRARHTGSLALENEEGIRRVVFRDGDFVTAASGVERESLVSFLIQRGAISQKVADQVGRRVPQFGRHAGAALIAHGHLRQDELWSVLRAHAEWLVGQAIRIRRGAASLEHEVPVRLSSEPAVFGGATGAEVLVELVRRVISPEEAIVRLGGADSCLVEGAAASLLGECALPESELALVSRAQSVPVAEVVESAESPDIAAVLYALRELGVLRRTAPTEAPAEEPDTPVREASDQLDEEARRAKIQARRALVAEGDYFALLGVPRGATAYDIRRAYLELRREFEPSRVLTAATADLRDEVDEIVEVLDEAFEILRDQVRRDRYRRALEAAPQLT